MDLLTTGKEAEIEAEDFQLSPEEETKAERLQFCVDYQALFINKFSGFKIEMDSKIEYAKVEFSQLSERSADLLKQFGCDTNRYKPKDLFELLFNFAKDFTDAYKRL